MSQQNSQSNSHPNSQPNSQQMSQPNSQPNSQQTFSEDEQKAQFTHIYQQMSDLKYDMIMKEKYFTRIMINISEFFESMEHNQLWISKPYFNILKKDVMVFVEQVNDYICEHMSGIPNEDLPNIDNYYNTVEVVYNNMI